MRLLFTILSLLFAIFAVVLSVLPLSNMAYIPTIAALVFGLIGFYLSKQNSGTKRIIQLAFLLTIIALVLTTYKAVFTTSEVGDTEELEKTEQQSEEDAIEELEDFDFEE